MFRASAAFLMLLLAFCSGGCGAIDEDHRLHQMGDAPLPPSTLAQKAEAIAALQNAHQNLWAAHEDSIFGDEGVYAGNPFAEAHTEDEAL